MTGYGEAGGGCGGARIRVDIRGVNGRYLDCNVRIARTYAGAEERIRSRVGKCVLRGKVDVSVNVDASEFDGARAEVRVNEALADSYLRAMDAIASKFSLERGVTAADIAGFPEVITVKKREDGREELYEEILRTLDLALADFDVMRRSEGGKLLKDISSRLDTMERLTREAEQASSESEREYQERLGARMRDILRDSGAQADETRILAEVAVFAARTAIDEETVRLASHIGQLRSALETGGEVGRRADFITQELNREANTIGAKCSGPHLSGIVIDMKSEIEKIREQIQNIE